MIVTLGVMAAAYVGGGVGYAVKAQGAAPAIAAHPHYDRMVQLAGLVQDGTTFAAARLRGRDGGGKEAAAPLLDAEAEPPPAGGGQQGALAAEPSAAADQAPSSDDDLVE